MESRKFQLDINQIQRFLPHRAPFLLIDRVLEIIPNDQRVGTRVVALKNVTYNEPYMQGHFPGFAIMPGVLLIEAMAQAASMALYPFVADQLDGIANRIRCILVGVENTKFRKPVIPGDTLRIEALVSKCRGKLWFFDIVALVEEKKVAECTLIANLEMDGQSYDSSNIPNRS